MLTLVVQWKTRLFQAEKTLQIHMMISCLSSLYPRGVIMRNDSFPPNWKAWWQDNKVMTRNVARTYEGVDAP